MNFLYCSPESDYAGFVVHRIEVRMPVHYLFLGY